MAPKTLGRMGLVAVAVGALVAWESYRLASQAPQTGTVGRPRPEPRSRMECDQNRPNPPETVQPGLTDITDAAGLHFQHVVGPLGTYFMPESIGAGGGVFDFNGDGLLDIYLVNCGRSPNAVGEFPPGTRTENRLWLQTANGTFTDATAASGLGDRGYGSGCAIGDVDNDGRPDVYLTNYGPDRLYRNNGDGTFRDVTDSAGLHNDDWATAAAFVDYNRDGWLDLVVVNYTADPKYGHSVACGFMEGMVSYCGPHKFEPTVDRLFRNEGLHPDDEGRPVVRFTDVTESAGLAAAPTYGFGVVCADFNRDHWPDLFIANDMAENRLWMNQHDGTFREEAVPRGVAVNGKGQAEAGMGVVVGDVNGDAALDLIVTHLSLETTTLYVNDGYGSFVDATDAAGVGRPTFLHTGWGAALVDLNHDGHLDLPLVHGLVVPCHSGFPYHGEDQFQVRHDVIEDPEAFWADYADLNLLLMNTGRGAFRDASPEAGDFATAIGSGRSLITGDVDNDGDADLLVTNCGGRARLYRNDMPKQGHWLMVRVMDPKLRRDAYGAEITVTAGGRTFHAVANPSSSYLASNDVRVHFGLGEVDHYDEIVIHWPDGPVAEAAEAFGGGRADRHLLLQRGLGRPVPPDSDSVP